MLPKKRSVAALEDIGPDKENEPANKKRKPSSGRPKN